MNTHTALTLPSPGRTEAPAIPTAPASDAPPAPPMLSIRHVSKHYRGVPAVQDVSFDVPAGRITGFVGPNGAGKSTVLRMALGLTRPDSGEVTVDGAPFADAAAPGRTVGALLSAESLPGHMTVRGHLGWAAATQGLPRRRVREVLDAVGLPHAGRRRIKGLSLGMRQRVGLAAALLGEPRLLVLDEPLNGLDTDAILALRSLLTDYAARGNTVLLSSHLMAELARVVDHVVMIRGGRLVAAGPLSDFESSGRTLEDAYLHLVHG